MNRDLRALLLVVASLALLLGYRAVFVEPREWAAACITAAPPLACAPRAALLWLQHWHLWGGAALLLGLWTFLGGPLAIRAAAVAVGAAAVVNYNATWGMLGGALGAWAWLGALARHRPRSHRPRSSAAEAAVPDVR